MQPILFQIGSIRVYSWGFFFALAVLVSALVAQREAKHQGLEPDITYDLALWAAIGGIIGSRIFYVIGNWPFYAQDLWKILDLRQGGLVFYGGLVGGTGTVLLYIKAKNLSVWKIGDIIAPGLAIGAAIGRFGCLLNGCCYGKRSNLAWSIFLADAWRHPTQIYEILMNLAIFAILWLYSRRSTREEGLVFWLYLLLYSLARFNVEFLRETREAALGLSASQVISIGIFLAASFRFTTKRINRSFYG